MTGPLLEYAAAMGIARRYLDITGTERETSAETARALLAAMRLGVEDDAEAAQRLEDWRAARLRKPLGDWQVVEAGIAVEFKSVGWEEWELILEDGSVAKSGVLRPCRVDSLPVGIHRLCYDGQETTILAAPGSLPAPPPGWGVTLPLYGLRTSAQGGLGDYGDLARAVTGLGAAGAQFVGINPIHAGFPAAPMAYSPYSPSSRRRLNVAHIPTPAVPDAPGETLIDYPAALKAKRDALASEYASFGGAPGFDAFLLAEGDALTDFATHQALSEHYGAYWSDWPEVYRDPASPEVAAFRAAHADRVRYHAWLQWRATEALHAVRASADREDMRHGLYLDLAVGTHPHGAETWAEQSLFAEGVSLGSPPDAFSADGQTWGLAPFDPVALAREGFRPLAETLRKQLSFSKLLRIDHILGFERTFWVPHAPGVPGGYVTMPREALLAVARIEAARAGATIIGEDLGNVPEGLRAALEASGVLGCRVAMFEQDYDAETPVFLPGDSYAAQTLASFATHDLPTYAGWRAGRDIEWRQRLGSIDGEQAAAAKTHRAAEVAAFDALAGEGADAMHDFLAGVGSRLVAVQIEDILGKVEQPNLPGTITDHPNWRRRLEVDVDALGLGDRVTRTAQIMARAGR